MSGPRYFTASNEPGAPPPSWPVRALNFGIALLLFAGVLSFSFWNLKYHLRWDTIYTYRSMFLQGWLTTIWISAAALVVSTIVGFCSALAQRSAFLPLRYASKIYVEIVRGTPLLAQILVFFYVIAAAFNVNNRYFVGVLTLAFFSGAYISEIIRAGIESVGRSQLESARAIGLTRAQTYRYVIIPQAIRQTLPPLAGQFVSLVKDSSLLSIIGISEFTLNAEMINARTYSTLESYLPLAVGYLVLTLPISIWTRRLEQRHKFQNVKLALNQLRKRFGKQLVLDDVSLSLEKVHTLALVGPSGGGKSTLLRIIGGLEYPDSGGVEINGEPVNFQEEALLAHRRSIGTVFQSFNLFPHLTALENITLPLEKVHARLPSEAEAIARQLLERFRLADHADKRPAELSGGQRQRVALARAISIKPKLLLFDEPTSALDPEMSAEVLDAIRELREEGRDFILVTHEMGFARQVADQVAFLAGGKIVEAGSAAQVFESPASEPARAFLAKVLKY